MTPKKLRKVVQERAKSRQSAERASKGKIDAQQRVNRKENKHKGKEG